MAASSVALIAPASRAGFVPLSLGCEGAGPPLGGARPVPAFGSPAWPPRSPASLARPPSVGPPSPQATTANSAMAGNAYRLIAHCIGDTMLGGSRRGVYADSSGVGPAYLVSGKT